MSQFSVFFHRLLISLMVSLIYLSVFWFAFGPLVGLIVFTLVFAIAMVFEIVGADIVLFLLNAKKVQGQSQLGQLWSNILSYKGKCGVKLYQAENLPFNLYYLDRLGRNGTYVMKDLKDKNLKDAEITALFEMALQHDSKNTGLFRLAFWIWLLFLPILPVAWILPKKYKVLFVKFFLTGVKLVEINTKRVISSESQTSLEPILLKLNPVNNYFKSVLLNHLLLSARCLKSDLDELPYVLNEKN